MEDKKLDQDFLFNNSMQFVWLVHLCLHGDFGNPCHGGLTSIPRADSLDSHLFQICASEQWWTSSKYSSRRVFGVLSIHYTCRKYTYNYIVHMMYLYIYHIHMYSMYSHICIHHSLDSFIVLFQKMHENTLFWIQYSFHLRNWVLLCQLSESFGFTAEDQLLCLQWLRNSLYHSWLQAKLYRFLAALDLCGWFKSGENYILTR